MYTHPVYTVMYMYITWLLLRHSQVASSNARYCNELGCSQLLEQPTGTLTVRLRLWPCEDPGCFKHGIRCQPQPNMEEHGLVRAHAAASCCRSFVLPRTVRRTACCFSYHASMCKLASLSLQPLLSLLLLLKSALSV